jgi:urea carboxylase
MTGDDREMLYNSLWIVGHNSNRTGVHLVGPKPQWSRKYGGAGGAHPSNRFDYSYPVSGVNWGADSPTMFSMDSPNISELICSSTMISAGLWRLGQLRPSNKVLLKPTTYDSAMKLIDRAEKSIIQV